MDAYATTNLNTTANLTRTQPPAVALDVLFVSGIPLVGFALGYLPFGDRGDEASRNTPRLAKARTKLWDMRNSKKNYPQWTAGEAAGWGRLTTEAFRAFLTHTQAAAFLSSKGNALTAWESLPLP